MARQFIVSGRLNAREKRALENLIAAGDTLDFSEWLRRQIVDQATELDLIAPPAETQLSTDELHVIRAMNLDPEAYLERKLELQSEREAAAVDYREKISRWPGHEGLAAGSENGNGEDQDDDET